MSITLAGRPDGIRARRAVVLPLATAAVFSLAACDGGSDGGGRSPGSPSSAGDAASSSSPPASASAAASGEPEVGSTAIRVRIGATVLGARLRDVPASRDLVAQLPLVLTFRDLNDVEKISRLPRELSMDGVPPGADPAPRDIGYYAPSGDLVFYYGDVGYFTGIVALGRFGGSVDAIQNQTGEFTATIELADRE